MNNSNPLKKEEKAIVWAAIIAGLLFFVFGFNLINSKNKIKITTTNTEAEIESIKSSEKNDEVNKLKNANLSLQNKNKELQEKNNNLNTKINSTDQDKSLKRELDKLSKQIKELQNDKTKITNRNKSKINNLEKSRSELNSVVKKLTNEKKKLKDFILNNNLSKENNKLKDKLELIENINIKYKIEINNLKDDIRTLKKSFKNKESDNQDKSYDKLVKENDKLSSLINNLKNKLLDQKSLYDKQISQQKDNAKQELQKIKNLINKKEDDNSAKEATPKYIVNKIDLREGAKSLVDTLTDIKNEDAGKLKNIYSKIEKNNKHKLLMSIPFVEGSADVAHDLKSEIISIIEKKSNQSSYLVVGYASEDGNQNFNKNLSNKRASSVANIIYTKITKNQKVQAYHLGSTKRFNNNDLSSNRRVEIWEIK